MGNLADYGISSVKYNEKHEHIVKVKLYECEGKNLKNSEEWTRSQVITAIDKGKSFMTILKDNNGNWIKGQDVHVVTVNGVKYIRSDGNKRTFDNLENLPEF